MKLFNDHLKAYRVRQGYLGSDDSYGMNGVFKYPLEITEHHLGTTSRIATIVASAGGGWEHVSVSFPDRCPTWDEMCKIKDLFWNSGEVVMQLHPSKDQYVNNFPYCLHLRRPIREKIPLPPVIMAGIKQ